MRSSPPLPRLKGRASRHRGRITNYLIGIAGRGERILRLSWVRQGTTKSEAPAVGGPAPFRGLLDRGAGEFRFTDGRDSAGMLDSPVL